MTETQVNVPLLRKAVEWAEAEAAKPPELCEWEQNYYVLPRDTGDPSVSGIPTGIGDYDLARLRRERGPECGTCFCVAGKVVSDADGIVPWSDSTAQRAAALLGLDHARADKLFHYSNTIADIRRVAEDIAGERL